MFNIILISNVDTGGHDSQVPFGANTLRNCPGEAGTEQSQAVVGK